MEKKAKCPLYFLSMAEKIPNVKVPSAAPPKFSTQPNPDFKSLTPASSPYLTPVIELI